MNLLKNICRLSKKLLFLYFIVNSFNLLAADLHTAVQEGNLYSVEKLLYEGAYVNERDGIFGLTPLHFAIIGKNLEIIELLLDYGAKINARDRFSNQNPRYLAEKFHIKYKYLKIIKFFDESDSVNMKDSLLAWTPLHVASYNNYLMGVKVLTDNRADVNARDRFGRTALHYFSLKGNLEAVKLLIEHKLDIDIKDRFGQTALDYARKKEHSKVVDLLTLKSKSLCAVSFNSI